MAFVKGQKRPEKAGRREGSVNIATAEVKSLAQEHGPAAIAKLAKIAENDEHASQVAALKELLDRGYGKPAQEVTNIITGELKVSFINDWRERKDK